MVVLGGPAAANHIACGTVVTSNVTLDSNIGPCPGDGLIVQGSGFTVRNGTVRNFDAGVVVHHGSGNTVMRVTAQDNANHVVRTGALNPCEFADGILVLDSDNNRIQSNQAYRNGPYGGIDIVGDSDNNLVTGNVSSDNSIPNFHPSLVTEDPEDNPEGLGPCGPFAINSPVGRLNQGIGIRIEGPGSDNNRVENNYVANNHLGGITIHGYVCHPPNNIIPPQPNNGGNVITRNNVVGNGFAGPEERADGIGILQQGPATIVCVGTTPSAPSSRAANARLTVDSVTTRVAPAPPQLGLVPTDEAEFASVRSTQMRAHSTRGQSCRACGAGVRFASSPVSY